MEVESSSETISRDEMLRSMASDYSDYMTVNIDKEEKVFDESVEELLTRLDEYCGLVDMVRSDTNLCLKTTLPAIHAKSLQMNKIFERIDQLEAFVSIVRNQVLLMEELVSQAENEMGSLSGIKKMFTNFSLNLFSKKKESPARSPTSVPKSIKFEPPEIYKTEDYIHYATYSKPGTSSGQQAGDTASGETHVVTSTESDNETVIIESEERKPRPKSIC